MFEWSVLLTYFFMNGNFFLSVAFRSTFCCYASVVLFEGLTMAISCSLLTADDVCWIGEQKKEER
jgi:hypothetical protein